MLSRKVRQEVLHPREQVFNLRPPMAEEFKTWLRRRMDARNLNQSQLALELGQAQSVVQRWLAGGAKPRADSAIKVADYFGVPRDDVLRLIGIVEEPPARPERSFTEALAELMADRPVAIPIHEQLASAGMGEEVLEYVYWPAPRAAGRNIIGLRVRGNSMEPELQDGDVIFVDKDAAPRSGSMVIATMKGSSGETLFVKWYRNDKSGNPVLEGNNGSMPASRAKIEGVVIQLSRDLR